MSEARQLQRRTWFTHYRTSDFAENVGSTFLVRGVQPRGKTDLILTVKIETRHSVGWPMSREFSAFVIFA